MVQDKAGEAWDFTPVIDLIHSLSSTSESHVQDSPSPGPSPPSSPAETFPESEPSLGNFDRLWQYLGRSPNRPLEVASFLRADENLERAYTKGVRWRDEVEGENLADNEHDNALRTSLRPSLGKRKKERKRKDLELRDRRQIKAKSLLSASDNDSDEREAQARQASTNRRALIYEILQRAPEDSAEKPSLTRSGKTYSQPALGIGKLPVADPQSRKVERPLEHAPKKGAIAAAAAAAKKATLLGKLRKNFPEEKQYLANPKNPVEDSLDGVHIFVDASNVNLSLLSLNDDTNFADNDRIPRLLEGCSWFTHHEPYPSPTILLPQLVLSP